MKKKAYSYTPSLTEKCAVFGAYTTDNDASRYVYTGLWALQHRGQESSGISVSDKRSIKTHRGTGLVARIYNEKVLQFLKGSIAIGHNRYGTSGHADIDHCQPVIHEHGLLALAHNGNLPSTTKLEAFLKSKHVDIDSYNDSELMHLALRYHLLAGFTIEEAVIKCFPLFTGVFCLVLLTENKLIAVRDAYGVRPLSIGTYGKNYYFSSETCALDTINATYVRDVKPGEMVVIDKKGLHSYQIAKGTQKLDIFEFVYFARPDSMLLGKSVNEVRKNLGRYLAKEYPIKADVVIPVPDSAIPAALGYSEVTGIPFDHGFIKNRYIHRTFIQPAQSLRERDVMLKLNPLPSVIKGKDVIVIDDSIVRGTTSKKIIKMLRAVGARKVYLLSSSPPVRFPDFYGINTPDQKELIATYKTAKEIESYVGADALKFLSYENVIRATELPEDIFNTSCFTGNYSVDIGEKRKEINFNLPPFE